MSWCGVGHQTHLQSEALVGATYISYTRNNNVVQQTYIHFKLLDVVWQMVILSSYMQVLHQTNSEEIEQTKQVKQHQGFAFC